MQDKARAHIIASGRVQGVFFRQHTRRQAEKLNIFGWVKNLGDGKVEAVFEGEKKSLEKIISWARQGPVFGKVNNLEVEWQDYTGEFDSFEVRY